MNNNKSLAVTVAGTQITVNDAKYSKLLGASGLLLGVIRFVAVQTGFCTEVDDKGKLTFNELKQEAVVEGETKLVSMSFKEAKAAIIKAGKATDEVLKTLETEYKVGKDAYYSACTQMSALIGADSSLRKVVRPVFGSKGDHLGFDTKARWVKASSSGSAGKDAKIAELEKQIAAFRLLLPAAAQS